jgi:rod shape-determining protein MreD
VVLGDAVAGGGDLLRVILVALLWDVLLTPLVLPGVMRLLTRLEPARA